MSQSTLIGVNKVSEAEVFQVPPGVYTKTYNPVSHKQVIEAVKLGVQAVGLDIVDTEYVLARDGQRMFTVWDLSQGTSELCWSIGIRNSLDKSMSIGITAGTRVFVCENLCFDGEYIDFRRHTSKLDIDELEFLAWRSMRKMVKRLTVFQQWHESLKHYDLSERDAKVLVVELMGNQVFPASKFSKFCELYFDVYDPTLWGLHESASDLLKDSNPMNLPKKNKLMNRVLNQYIDTTQTDAPSSLGDFFEQRAIYQNM